MGKQLKLFGSVSSEENSSKNRPKPKSDRIKRLQDQIEFKEIYG